MVFVCVCVCVCVLFEVREIKDLNKRIFYSSLFFARIIDIIVNKWWTKNNRNKLKFSKQFLSIIKNDGRKDVKSTFRLGVHLWWLSAGFAVLGEGETDRDRERMRPRQDE